MTGAAIEFQVDDRRAQEGFATLSKAMRDTTPVMEEIGVGVMGSTVERFASQTGPDGGSWAALNPAYASGKRNTRILTESGRLRDSITYKAGRDQVAVGSNVIYAAIHQFGGTINAKGGGRLAFFIGGQLVRPTSVTLPARPYLGISSDDETMIGAIIKKHVNKYLP